jgi:hypothetical protein
MALAKAGTKGKVEAALTTFNEPEIRVHGHVPRSSSASHRGLLFDAWEHRPTHIRSLAIARPVAEPGYMRGRCGSR